MDLEPNLSVGLMIAAGVFALGALYFLLLRRDSTMLGFLCIVGVAVIGIIGYWPGWR